MKPYPIKYIITIVLIVLSVDLAFAQKVDVKNGIIQVEGIDYAKIVKIKDKQNFGLTSTFEVYTLKDEKIIIAAVATDFVQNENDNSTFFYRLSFLTAGQQGVFAVSRLSAEKNLVKLIGQSGILINNQVDPKMLMEFIAKKSRNPQVAIEYTLVERPHLGSVRMKGNNIIQGLTTIGCFKDVTNNRDFDTYEFYTAMGLLVAKVSFTGGLNAQSFLVNTYKDKQQQNVRIPTEGKYSLPHQDGVDRNEMALIRIADWLINKWYL